MDVSREKGQTGRWRQRRRTRRALIEAGRRVVARGGALSIAAVAEEAEVSRATAYRYFPSDSALLLELQLEDALPDIEEVLHGDRGTLEERVAHVQRAWHEHAIRNEAVFRLYLRALDEKRLQDPTPSEPLRTGRRLAVLDQLLAPLRERMSEDEYSKLRHALSVVIGIDAFLVFKDVCGLDDAAAGEAGAWAVRTLIRGALGGEDT